MREECQLYAKNTNKETIKKRPDTVVFFDESMLVLYCF